MAASPLSNYSPGGAGAGAGGGPPSQYQHLQQYHQYNQQSTMQYSAITGVGQGASSSSSSSSTQAQAHLRTPSTSSASVNGAGGIIMGYVNGGSFSNAQMNATNGAGVGPSSFSNATTSTHHMPSSASGSSSFQSTTNASTSSPYSSSSRSHAPPSSSTTAPLPSTSSSVSTSIIPLTRTDSPHLHYQQQQQHPGYSNGAIQHPHPHPHQQQQLYHPPSTASSSQSHSSSLYQHPQLQQPAEGSASTSTSSPSSPAQASSSKQQQQQQQPQQPQSFFRDGDIIYDGGPPPPTNAPVVGTRNYTILKEVGDGSFGTVWLADWHSPLALPKGTTPPGPSSRPEYKGKRLVALKRMKKAFEGGWDECMKLKELRSLRSIAAHPNIIPLYDAFLLPTTKELYFVFECMEGNLYQLTKSRKGRPLAAGLVASLLKQMLQGLHHIHQSGYFHRDMKPENLLITTTGLADYPPYIAPQHINNPSIANRPPEKDVVAVVKIADFGLARETRSKPPYTEYVSTRWYRAPEVILRSRDYSHPVDMWAIGTILSEMVNLKPLFPGQSEVDQVFRICEILGDPTSDYGVDSGNRIKGGGYWDRATKMAKAVGFSFPKIPPIQFESLYDRNLIPYQLVDMMADLMRYDPRIRLTTAQCLEHPYFVHVAPMLEATPVVAVTNHIRQQIQQSIPQQQNVYSLPTPSSAHSYGLPAPNSASFPAPRNVPSSHTSQTQASQFSRASFEQRHQLAPGSSASYSSHQSPLSHPPHHLSQSTSSADYAALQQQQQQQQQRDRQVSMPHSLISNDSVGLGSMHMVQSTSVTSPSVGYPESVNDVSMDGADETALAATGAVMNGHHHHHSGRDSPSSVSLYSHNQSPKDVLPPPQVAHQLPPPHPHHYASPYQQSLRQGVNGYTGSTHSGSLYNPSVYSGVSAHSGGSGDRRGSAGGASTFYDGSIFEGIAPTRAASILSLPVAYGEAPPSPNFAMPSNYPSSVHSHQVPSNLGPGTLPHIAALRRARTEADNVSVDFEREAIQRSQNHPHPSNPVVAIQGVPKSDSQESLKASKGKKSWMSNLLGNNNSNSSVGSSAASTHSAQPHYHPQQQPLIHASSYAASSASSASLHHYPSNAAPSISGSSLKRTPSERSIHQLEQPPTRFEQQQQQSAAVAAALPLDPKKAKKEAERLAKEAEKAKRELAQKAARDRARAVMQKRNALAQAADPLHSYGQMPPSASTSSNSAAASTSKALSDKEKKILLEQRKQQAMMNGGKLPQIAEDPRMRLQVAHPSSHQYNPDARYKARRRDDDDDVHSMSSNETRSERRFSISSQNTMSTVSTMDSDPGPGRGPARQGAFLAPLRRSPSASSFSGQSHLSVGSTGSGHAPASGYGRRDLGTSGSGTSSLEYGLVGRFKGLSAADAASSNTSPSSASPHPESPVYFRPPHSPSAPHPGHPQHNISLPPIQSFDRPPPKEFVFSSSDGVAPQTSHSNHSNNSTISANSRQYSHSSGQLPFTPEMYQHHLQHSQQPQ